jgi:hypothetical protein
LSLDTKGWLTQARLDARVVALVTTDRSLAQARADEQSDAHGSHDDELEWLFTDEGVAVDGGVGASVRG